MENYIKNPNVINLLKYLYQQLVLILKELNNYKNQLNISNINKIKSVFLYIKYILYKYYNVIKFIIFAILNIFIHFIFNTYKILSNIKNNKIIKKLYKKIQNIKRQGRYFIKRLKYRKFILKITIEKIKKNIENKIKKVQQIHKNEKVKQKVKSIKFNIKNKIKLKIGLNLNINIINIFKFILINIIKPINYVIQPLFKKTASKSRVILYIGRQKINPLIKDKINYITEIGKNFVIGIDKILNLDASNDLSDIKGINLFKYERNSNFKNIKYNNNLFYKNSNTKNSNIFLKKQNSIQKISGSKNNINTNNTNISKYNNKNKMLQNTSDIYKLINELFDYICFDKYNNLNNYNKKYLKL